MERELDGDSFMVTVTKVENSDHYDAEIWSKNQRQVIIPRIHAASEKEAEGHAWEAYVVAHRWWVMVNPTDEASEHFDTRGLDRVLPLQSCGGGLPAELPQGFD